MANRLTEQHRKCIKSPNIFRDKQEYSSLYTISSRSALSLQSTEMMSSKHSSPGQNRMFKGQHYKGDSVENVKSQPYKYPKLPNDISLELQQKVYSSSQYYSDRTQLIKNKFDSLTLENNKQQYPKPYCPMHITTNRQPQPNPPGQPQYAINRLEESYWAKWKPNKCDSTDTWQSYSNQTPCSTPCSARRSRCITTPMMSKECLDMLSKSKRRPKTRCYDDKPLEVIREPADIHESNSSDVGVTKTASNKKVESKCSCCTCPSQSKSNSDEEKTSKTKTDVPTEEYDDDQNDEDNVNLETSQEEYENLYNEMYVEYETQLMNRISEYEMQREQEEMYELEKQLAKEEERKRREQEAQNEAEAMLHDRNPSVHNVDAIDFAENESHTNTPVQQSQFSSPRNTPVQQSQFSSPRNTPVQQSQFSSPRNTPVQQSQFSSSKNTPRQIETKQTPSKRPEEEIRPITAIEQSRNTPNEMPLDNPGERRPQTAANTRERGGASPKEMQSSFKENRSPQTPSNEYDRKDVEDEQRKLWLLRNTNDVQQTLVNERNNTELEDEQRRLMLKNVEDRNQIELEDEQRRLKSLKNTQNRRQSTSSEHDRIEVEDEQRRLRLLKTTQETQLMPHLSSSNEYSEPEISILKHTDSFIINSRRQKEDRPRKQQPKFLKLKSSLIAPPVKGHTYPLKPALKKEKPSPPPIIGFSRPLSPVSPKVRSSSKPPQYLYLLRH